jgi:hypothetical protein
MLDNGAFTAWTKGRLPDWQAFYRWAEPNMRHPNWSVIPDVIDGDEEANNALLIDCSIPRDFAAPVWHLHEHTDRLAKLSDEYPRICFGSSGAYAKPGTVSWTARIDEAWNMLERTGRSPWVHMLRAMKEASEGAWPFRIGRQHKHCSQSRRVHLQASANT